VETAENGEEAVKRYSEEPFDLVLMDVQMPKMDGLKATRAIREWETERGIPPRPVLALTANALREDEERSRSSGCTEHLAKPIKRGVLLAALRRHLPEDGSLA
jgi:CheY-like chemotaxis protein